MNKKGEVNLEISYENTEEKYIELLLKDLFKSKKTKFKFAGLIIFVLAIFIALCISRYTYDMQFYGYLKRESSFTLLIYIICAILWSILLPIIAWKFKSISIMKEIDNMNIPFEGQTKYTLKDETIVFENNLKRIESNYKGVKSIIDKNTYVELIISNYSKFIIPIEAFEDDNEKLQFINTINENKKVKEEEETDELII